MVGTSAILGSGFIDAQGRNPNALFMLNLIDAMNGREDRALMRTKGRRVRPLRDIEPPVRTAVKTFAVAGLPALVVLVGVVVWVLGGMRRHRIRTLYGTGAVPPSEAEDTAPEGAQADAGGAAKAGDGAARGRAGSAGRGGAKGGTAKSGRAESGPATGGGASC